MEKLDKKLSYDTLKDYSKLKKKKIFLIIGILILIFLSVIVDILTGPAMLSIKQVISTIFNLESTNIAQNIIIWDMRIPMAIMAIIVGCNLGISGALMQTILLNPLSSPYTLGIGSGASFGASFAILFLTGLKIIPPEYIVAITAFIFAMAACLIIYLIGKFKNMSTSLIVLSGIAMLFTFQSLQALLQFGANEHELQNIIFWTFGSLQKVTWIKLIITLIILVLIFPLIMKNIWKYTALLLGDEKATSLGINVAKLKIITYLYISLLSATAISFVGTIGFVGLVSPHITRVLVGEDQRYFIPVSGIMGGLILSVASILSKVVIPGIIFPIGIITSLIGVPFFFFIVFKSR